METSTETIELIGRVKSDFSKFNNRCKVDGVTGFRKSDSGWSVDLEVVERKAIPDSLDIMGIYEVLLDKSGGFVSFERKKLRKRSDTGEA